MNLKYKLNECITEVTMGKRPILIVEGPDDVLIYEDLAKQAAYKLSVRQVTYYEGEEALAGGSSGVQGCMRLIQPLQAEAGEEVYVMGIVDRDVMPFRQADFEEAMQAFNIHVLRYYSIESYFIGLTNLEQTLRTALKLPQATRRGFAAQLWDTWNTSPEKQRLYRFSLACLHHALRGACIQGLSYSGNWVLNLTLNLSEEEDLLVNRFEAEQALNLERYREVIKGKHLFQGFANWLFCKINQEKDELCKDKTRPQCEACRTGNDCCYRTQEGYNEPILRTQLKAHIDLESFSDVVNALERLAYLKGA